MVFACRLLVDVSVTRRTHSLSTCIYLFIIIFYFRFRTVVVAAATTDQLQPTDNYFVLFSFSLKRYTHNVHQPPYAFKFVHLFFAHGFQRVGNLLLFLTSYCCVRWSSAAAIFTETLSLFISHKTIYVFHCLFLCQKNKDEMLLSIIYLFFCYINKPVTAISSSWIAFH